MIYTQDDLIILIREKNQHAFSYLYDHYSKTLFQIIRRTLPSDEEAEEVLQNVFIKVWRHFDQYDEKKGRLYTWMVKISQNNAIDALRKRSITCHNSFQISDAIYYKNNMRLDHKNHDFIGIKNIVNALTDEQRTIIDLVYFEGYTQLEVSIQLNIPLGTVKTKIRQAIASLRNFTKEEHLYLSA